MEKLYSYGVTSKTGGGGGGHQPLPPGSYAYMCTEMLIVSFGQIFRVVYLHDFYFPTIWYMGTDQTWLYQIRLSLGLSTDSHRHRNGGPDQEGHDVL